jgi:glycerol kinase
VEEIWRSVRDAVVKALESAGVKGQQVAAIGITNQRETTVVWDRASLAPIHRAIVWQCRRTAGICDSLRASGHEALVRRRTGLVLDAYFSGTKVAWILDNVVGARASAESGKLAFGTIDSFLIAKLTQGTVHVTDATNASRTLLMGLESGAWDDEMLALFRVPKAVLPKIVGSAEIVGRTQGLGFLPDGIAIAGIAGDQQAALFGQACFQQGDAKCTYGTGAFVLANIGSKPLWSNHGLVTTVAWKIGGQLTYALEGSSFIAGAAVQWLRDGLGIIKKASEVEALANQVSSSDGVMFVPALSGLGAPFWDPAARGTITGLTRGSTAAHLARATLEGIAFQVEDLLHAMAKDAGRNLVRLRVDGGASLNNLLMQFQSDIAGLEVERPTEVESTSRGAAMLARVGANLARLEGAGNDAVSSMVKVDRVFKPSMSDALRIKSKSAWADAVARSRGQAAIVR